MVPFMRPLSSPELKRLLDKVCRLAGVKKQFIVEEALREKVEDLLDAYDLREAIKSAGEFYPSGAKS